MKKSLMVIAFLVMTSLTTAQELVTYSKSGFEAIFPSKPKIEKESVDAGGYKIKLTMYMVENSSSFIMVGESLMPKEIVEILANENTMILLKSTKDGAMTNFAASLGSEFELTHEEEIEFQGFPALKVEGKIKDSKINALYVYRVGQLYQIMVFGENNETEYTNFIKSFKFI